MGQERSKLDWLNGLTEEQIQIIIKQAIQDYPNDIR